MSTAVGELTASIPFAATVSTGGFAAGRGGTGESSGSGVLGDWGGSGTGAALGEFTGRIGISTSAAAGTAGDVAAGDAAFEFTVCLDRSAAFSEASTGFDLSPTLSRLPTTKA